MNNSNINSNVERKIVCGEDTGKVYAVVNWDFKIVKKNDNNIVEKYDFNFGKKLKFVKINTDTLFLIDNLLTPNEMRVLLMLLPLVSYDDCILRKNGHGNGVILRQCDISDMTPLSIDIVKKTFPSLKKKDIIKEMLLESNEYKNKKIKCIVLNPYIVCRGTKILQEVKIAFKESVYARLYSEE